MFLKKTVSKNPPKITSRVYLILSNVYLNVYIMFYLQEGTSIEAFVGKYARVKTIRKRQSTQKVTQQPKKPKSKHTEPQPSTSGKRKSTGKIMQLPEIPPSDDELNNILEQCYPDTTHRE